MLVASPTEVRGVPDENHIARSTSRAFRGAADWFTAGRLDDRSEKLFWKRLLQTLPNEPKQDSVSEPRAPESEPASRYASPTGVGEHVTVSFFSLLLIGLPEHSRNGRKNCSHPMAPTSHDFTMAAPCATAAERSADDIVRSIQGSDVLDDKKAAKSRQRDCDDDPPRNERRRRDVIHSSSEDPHSKLAGY
ncbi:hypothetical protein HPB47_011348 [Ixodes persulcatus]|uniref:Uncharacterized protein n=1 Tax=Ixodes persulcatus TaxID=34615 RepID=A0AC60NWH9_IXOPE|nr:hypothetical protein HPB47_011348 [Ixodes persulcatus]